MNVVIVGHVDHGKSHPGRAPARRHRHAAATASWRRSQATASARASRSSTPSCSTRCGRAGPGHHHRRRPLLLQDRAARLHHHRRARAHRVPQEHDLRRRPRRGRRADHRRQGGRAREQPPPRLHPVDARHPPGGGRASTRWTWSATTEAHFRAHRGASTARSSPSIGAVAPAPLHPDRARVDGENLADAQRAAWPGTTGPTLLEALDGFAKAPPKPRPAAAHAGAGRLQVHRARRRPPHHRRPHRGRAACRSATRWCSRRRTSRPRSRASRRSTRPPRTRRSTPAGRPASPSTEEIYVTRGEVMSHAEHAAAGVSTRFRVNLIWLGQASRSSTGRDYKLKLGTAAAAGAASTRSTRCIDASDAGRELEQGAASAATTWPTWCWRRASRSPST